MSETIPIKADDLWVKVVEMLQQNWASIETEHDGVRVYFISDTSEVFDEMVFASLSEAEAGLARNGFRRFKDSPDLQHLLKAPEPPFAKGSHPNGPIYSSGKFWN